MRVAWTTLFYLPEFVGVRGGMLFLNGADLRNIWMGHTSGNCPAEWTVCGPTLIGTGPPVWLVH